MLKTSSQRAGGKNSPAHSFNPFLTLTSEAGHALVHDLIERFILPLETRKQRRSAKQAKRLFHAVNTVCANLANLTLEGATTLQYYRKAEMYSQTINGYYNNPDIGRTHLLGVIDTLLDQKLLFGTTGVLAPHKNIARRSSVSLSVHLKNQIVDAIPGRSHIALDRGVAPVILLKNSVKRRIPISLEDLELAKIDKETRRINRHLQQFELMRFGAANIGSSKTLRAVSHTWLYRVFSNSSLNQCGRFFGGWWQLMGAGERKHILIDAEPTCELDYRGMLTRTIYNLEGIECPRDPYEIPVARKTLSALGVADIHHRGIIKNLMNWSYCSTSFERSKTIKGCDPYREAGMPLDDRRKVMKAIAAFHWPISEYFYKGEGLKFMFTESQVCNAILLRSIRDGKAVLPIHDSFIAKQSDRGWLRDVMEEEYWRLTGFKPVLH